MADFNDLESLKKYLEDKIEDAMKKVGSEAVDKVREQMDEDVYSYRPKMYKRTFQLKTSLRWRSKKNKDGSVRVSVSHDLRRIRPQDPNQHYSVYPTKRYPDPESVYRVIPYIVHEGKSGKVFGKGFWTKPRRYFDNARKDIERTSWHIDRMKKLLGDAGLNIE